MSLSARGTASLTCQHANDKRTFWLLLSGCLSAASDAFLKTGRTVRREKQSGTVLLRLPAPVGRLCSAPTKAENPCERGYCGGGGHGPDKA